ncbi:MULTISPECIES: ABC transporter permease [unclassified Leifsonia]|uniref:ABC transporter permease n=1 Tax=unclassified Leifsonia TaxID=2663824 RepID=UPI0006F27CFB|nr:MULTISPECIES: ABC transporter permease subunit [unclassified Leifsonia]KQX07742.1 ABC transporter permease [Leifsonia sp. Root1293]KRA12024.1 ABC transporter permease [Leifsonia sp. Root60]
MKWLSQNIDGVVQLFIVHLALAIPAVVIGVMVAVPIGWAVQGRRWAREPSLAVVGLLYAIPSLPLFVLIPVIFGVGLRSAWNAIIVLTIYATAIMVRASADAFTSVPEQVRLAASAIGYSSLGRFWAVDLPLAVPGLVAGLRVVVVSTVSLVTVSSVIGISSLGTLFTDGFQRGIVAEVITGICLVVLIGVLLDGLCVLTGRAVAPWARRRKAA